MGGFVYSLLVHAAVFAVLLTSSSVEPRQSHLVQVQLFSAQPKPLAAPSQVKKVTVAARPPVDNSIPDASIEKTQIAESNQMINLQQPGVNADVVYGYLVNLIYKNRIYPYESIRLKQQGQVTLSFYINEVGELTDISLIKPSDHRQLNHAAVSTLRALKLNRDLPRIESLFRRQYSFTFDFELIKSL